MPNKIDETLKEVKKLSFKIEGRIFIVSFASLSVGMLQSKKGNGFLSSHHCLWNSPWTRVLKQYPIGFQNIGPTQSKISSSKGTQIL